VIWGKTHYLDASALVKLVADDPDEEPGREALRKYYSENRDSVYATSYCVTETLSAFKIKFLKHRITEDQYIKYVLEFRRLYIGVNLRVEDVPILSQVVTTEAERLIKKHKIDFLDCFQIITMMRGRFAMLGPNSQSILITADRDLAMAARAEGAKVWECTTEAAPTQYSEV